LAAPTRLSRQEVRVAVNVSSSPAGLPFSAMGRRMKDEHPLVPKPLPDRGVAHNGQSLPLSANLCHCLPISAMCAMSANLCHVCHVCHCLPISALLSLARTRFRLRWVEGRTNMPLRDHFHPPVNKRRSWEGFYGAWPAMIVMALARRMSLGYVAEPRVHLGASYEETCRILRIE